MIMGVVIPWVKILSLLNAKRLGANDGNWPDGHEGDGEREVIDEAGEDVV